MNESDRPGYIGMGGDGGRTRGSERERKRQAIPGRANGTSFLPRVMKMLQLGLKHTEEEDEC